MSRFTSIVVALGVTALVGCKDKQEEAPPQQEPVRVEAPSTQTAPAAPAGGPAAEAEKYFKARCVVCHGTTGAGDGPGAAAIDPKPRAFADPAWQDETSDEDIAKIITEGGAAVGKSPGMPAHPDIKGKPEVLKELVALVRGFREDG